MNLDLAADAVAHPTGEFKALGLLEDKIAEADALNAPLDDGMISSRLLFQG